MKIFALMITITLLFGSTFGTDIVPDQVCVSSNFCTCKSDSLEIKCPKNTHCVKKEKSPLKYLDCENLLQIGETCANPNTCTRLDWALKKKQFTDDDVIKEIDSAVCSEHGTLLYKDGSSTSQNPSANKNCFFGSILDDEVPFGKICMHSSCACESTHLYNVPFGFACLKKEISGFEKSKTMFIVKGDNCVEENCLCVLDFYAKKKETNKAENGKDILENSIPLIKGESCNWGLGDSESDDSAKKPWFIQPDEHCPSQSGCLCVDSSNYVFQTKGTTYPYQLFLGIVGPVPKIKVPFNGFCIRSFSFNEIISISADEALVKEKQCLNLKGCVCVDESPPTADGTTSVYEKVKYHRFYSIPFGDTCFQKSLKNRSYLYRNDILVNNGVCFNIGGCFCGKKQDGTISQKRKNCDFGEICFERTNEEFFCGSQWFPTPSVHRYPEEINYCYGPSGMNFRCEKDNMICVPGLADYCFESKIGFGETCKKSFCACVIPRSENHRFHQTTCLENQECFYDSVDRRAACSGKTKLDNTGQETILSTEEKSYGVSIKRTESTRFPLSANKKSAPYYYTTICPKYRIQLNRLNEKIYCLHSDQDKGGYCRGDFCNCHFSENALQEPEKTDKLLLSTVCTKNQFCDNNGERPRCFNLDRDFYKNNFKCNKEFGCACVGNSDPVQTTSNAQRAELCMKGQYCLLIKDEPFCTFAYNDEKTISETKNDKKERKAPFEGKEGVLAGEKGISCAWEGSGDKKGKFTMITCPKNTKCLWTDNKFYCIESEVPTPIGPNEYCKNRVAGCICQEGNKKAKCMASDQCIGNLQNQKVTCNFNVYKGFHCHGKTKCIVDRDKKTAKEVNEEEGYDFLTPDATKALKDGGKYNKPLFDIDAIHEGRSTETNRGQTEPSEKKQVWIPISGEKRTKAIRVEI